MISVSLQNSFYLSDHLTLHGGEMDPSNIKETPKILQDAPVFDSNFIQSVEHETNKLLSEDEIRWNGQDRLEVNGVSIYDSDRNLYELEKVSNQIAWHLLDSCNYIPEGAHISLTVTQLESLLNFFDATDNSCRNRLDLNLTIFLGTLYSLQGQAIESDDNGNVNHMSRRKLENFLSIFEKVPKIEQLHFYCQDITDDSIVDLFSYVHPNLEYLVFHDCDNLHPRIFENINFEESLPDLKAIRFTHSDHMDHNVLHYLKNHLSLQALIFDNVHQLDLSCLESSGLFFPGIKMLSLANTRLNDNNLRYIAKTFPNLEALNISRLQGGNKSITDEGISYLTNLESLKHLHLGGLINVSQEGIDKLDLDQLETIDTRFTKASSKMSDKKPNAFYSEKAVEQEYTSSYS